MYKRKTKLIVMTFIIWFISLTVINCGYAKKNEMTDNWDVTITSDAKEINDTHKIKFNIQGNQNVVPGKIAPGMKAIAEVDINLEKVRKYVDIIVKIDDSKLNDIFKLKTKLNGESISSQNIVKVQGRTKTKLTLELIWNESNQKNTLIGKSVESIEIPVQIKVLQSI